MTKRTRNIIATVAALGGIPVIGTLAHQLGSAAFVPRAEYTTEQRAVHASLDSLRRARWEDRAYLERVDQRTERMLCLTEVNAGLRSMTDCIR
jgi:hypothetical protein